MFKPDKYDLITTTDGDWVFLFKHTGDKKIVNVIKTCGCTDIVWSQEKIVATLEVKPLGDSIVSPMSKSIIVQFEDGTTHNLKMNLILKKEL